MRAQCRGATLIELLASLAALGSFGATLSALSQHVNGERRAAEGREADLAGLRRAARALEDDLRAGVDPVGAGWRAYRGELIRDREVLARSVESLDLRREGDLWHVAIAMNPRAAEGPRRRCVLEWTVRARAPEAAR